MSLNGLPGVAQVAIQSGRHAAQTIVRRLRGDTSERPFRYRDKGTLATISRFRAVAAVGRIRASGFPAWVLWLAVHLIALTGFKNRVAVLFQLDGRLPRQRPPAARDYHAASLRPPVARVPGRPHPHPRFRRSPSAADRPDQVTRRNTP